MPWLLSPFFFAYLAPLLCSTACILGRVWNGVLAVISCTHIFVGPGEYDEDKKHHHVGGVMLSEKPRFQVLKSRAPGPGAYNVIK